MKPDSWRVAVASRDGKVINEHFGRASEFLIADVYRDGSYKFIEKRTVKPLCSAGTHSDEALLSHISVLRDCIAVLAAQTGPSARRALEMNGIPVFDIPDYIDTTLQKLAGYFAKTIFSSEE
jgi:Dinitrogenase iron-molybdenum cofactor.